MADNYWYVTEAGDKHGPYTDIMMAKRIADGTLGKSSLVWKAGWPAWQPISLHFDLAAGEHSSMTAATVELQIRSISPYFPSAGSWCLLALSIVAFGAYVFDIPQTQISDAQEYVWWRFAIISGMVFGGGGWAYSWWRWSTQIKSTNTRQGLIRVGIICWSAALAVATVVGVATAPLEYRIHVARANFDRYSIDADVLSETLSIRGLIGPGLAKKVELQLRANARIKTLALDSVGGLVDEALATAREIQQQGGLETRVVGSCNSACILVFMAGEKRIAARQLQFGFHATSSITPLEGAYNLDALEQLSNNAQKYLEGRGIPKEFISAARAAGPTHLAPVSAVQMANVGAVTQLTDGGDAISLDRAKWLAVIDSLEGDQSTKEILSLFRTIDGVLPSIGTDVGPKLWADAQTGDYAGIAATTRELIGELAARALPAAGDGAVSELIRTLAAEAEYIRNQGKWDVCNGFLAGNGFGGIEVPPDLARMEFAAAAALVRSAADHQWQPQPVPVWASAESQAIAKSVAAAMLANGEKIQTLESDPQVACDWATNLMRAVANTTPQKATAIYRWLNSQK